MADTPSGERYYASYASSVASAIPSRPSGTGGWCSTLDADLHPESSNGMRTVGRAWSEATAGHSGVTSNALERRHRDRWPQSTLATSATSSISGELRSELNTWRASCSTDAMGTVGDGKLALRGLDLLCAACLRPGPLWLVAGRHSGVDAETEVRFDPKSPMQMAWWPGPTVDDDCVGHGRFVTGMRNDMQVIHGLARTISTIIVVPPG